MAGGGALYHVISTKFLVFNEIIFTFLHETVTLFQKSFTSFHDHFHVFAL